MLTNSEQNYFLIYGFSFYFAWLILYFALIDRFLRFLFGKIFNTTLKLVVSGIPQMASWEATTKLTTSQNIALVIIQLIVFLFVFIIAALLLFFLAYTIVKPKTP